MYSPYFLIQSFLLYIFFHMIDFSKIYCRQHPGEIVINFCSQSDCYQGLCPTCLCEHTQQHTIQGTQPKYENIRGTFTRVHTLISQHQSLISEDMNRLSKVFESIQQKKECFRETLQEVKEQCLNYVSECFQELGKHWEKEIQTAEKRAGLQDKYKLDTLSALVRRQMERLVDEAKTMNSPGFHQKIKRLESEALVQSSKFHQKVAAQLALNQQYDYNLTYSKDSLPDLKETIKKILRLQLTMPLRTMELNSRPASPEKIMKKSQSASNFKPNNQNKESRISFGRQSVDINASKKTNPFESGIVSPSQRMSYSNILTIPKVLTTSLLQGSPSQQLKITSNFSTLEKKGMNQNMKPEYASGIDLSKFSRRDTVEGMKNQGKKKSGLNLMTPKVTESLILKEKENDLK